MTRCHPIPIAISKLDWMYQGIRRFAELREGFAYVWLQGYKIILLLGSECNLNSTSISIRRVRVMYCKNEKHIYIYTHDPYIYIHDDQYTLRCKKKLAPFFGFSFYQSEYNFWHLNSGIRVFIMWTEFFYMIR